MGQCVTCSAPAPRWAKHQECANTHPHASLGEERFPCRGCHGRLRVLGSDSAHLPTSTELADVVTGADARLQVSARALDELETAEGLGDAAAAGDEDEVRRLLYDEGAHPNRPKSRVYDQTPLHRASANGRAVLHSPPGENSAQS